MRSLVSWLVTLAAVSCASSNDDGLGSGAASPAATSGGSSTPTYHADVAPILVKHCNGCHTAGGIAPFAFSRYEDVAPLAQAIRSSTEARTMPPWPVDNSGTCHTWKDARWLSDDDLATLASWADAGAPEGTPLATDPPAPSAPELDVVSATLDMGTSYTPDDGVSDDYRCFLVDPGIATAKYLTAYQVRPGEPRVVHHVILYAVETDADAEAVEQLDAADAGPGYRCFGGAGVAAHLVAGWAPGTPITRYPADTGLEIEPNRKLVLQVHYNLAQGPLPDRTAVDLTLVDTVKRPARVDLVSDGGFTLPPNSTEAKAGKSITVPVGGTVFGVFPHMHQLGRSIRIERTSKGERSCMADVPLWNFHWQQFYFYDEPLELAAGDELTVSCRFGTTGVMKPVSFGEGTDDEMCLAFFYSTLGDAACSSCSAAVTGKGDPTNVCASSLDAFSALSSCVCQVHCNAECGGNVCVGGTPPADCLSCLQNACPAELSACLADK